MSYVLQNLSLWRVRKTAQQPPVKTLCPWEPGKVNHLRQRWPVFTTVKIPTSEGKFSRGQTIYAEKAHTASTADCLNFPSGFLLGVASNVYYLQLLERRDRTQRNASVMRLCRHIHASLYWLPDISARPAHCAHGHSRTAPQITHNTGWQSGEEMAFMFYVHT